MIITFFTPNYAPIARKLIKSGRLHGYEVTAVEVEERGSWEANCNQKSVVIRDALEDNEHILFLDADATIHGNIDDLLVPGDGIMLDKIHHSKIRAGFFAQRYRYHAVKRSYMWNSGVMSLSHTQHTMELMDAWVEMCNQRPTEWDQWNLRWAWEQTAGQCPVYDTPIHCKIGKGRLGHRSAFHSEWKQEGQKPWRRVLLLGSAPYIKHWWKMNRDEYLDKGFAIVAMNNACEVAGDDCDLWLVPDDYSGQFTADKHIPTNRGGYFRATNKQRNWINTPLWARKPTTIMLSSLAHLHNEALLDRCGLEVHVAGCDMNYSGRKTHFYGNGGKDPLRYDDQRLILGQREIMKAYVRAGFRLYNVGGQEETRLVFRTC